MRFFVVTVVFTAGCGTRTPFAEPDASLDGGPLACADGLGAFCESTDDCGDRLSCVGCPGVGEDVRRCVPAPEAERGACAEGFDTCTDGHVCVHPVCGEMAASGLCLTPEERSTLCACDAKTGIFDDCQSAE